MSRPPSSTGPRPGSRPRVRPQTAGPRRPSQEPAQRPSSAATAHVSITKADMLRQRRERQADWEDRRRAERDQFTTCMVGNSLRRGERVRSKRDADHERPFRDPASDPLQTPLYAFQVHEVYEHDVPNMRPPSAVLTVPTHVDDAPFRRRVRPLSAGASRPPMPSPSPGPGGAAASPSSLRPVSPVASPSMLSPSPAVGEAEIHVQMGELGESPISPSEYPDVPPPASARPMLPVDPDEAIAQGVAIAAARRPPPLPAVAVAPDDATDISLLSTAEDVISFFSEKGNSSDVKFVYLKAATKGLLFRPYDLEVVSIQQSPGQSGHKGHEYFCISASGSVHMRPGQPSEVVSLAEWMRECTLFDVLTRIRFFRHYLVGKAFTQWRRNVRFHLYCATRRRLAKNFFLSKQTFAQPLHALHKAAFELFQMPLMKYPTQKEKACHIDQFKEIQQTDCRVPAQAEFQKCMERMESTLLRLAKEVTLKANVPDLTTQESLEQYLLATAAAESAEKGKTGKKTKSMVEARDEQRARMRMLKRAMEEHKILNRFIRLVDYVAVEQLFKNALATVHNFFEVLRHDGDKLVMFRITIAFQGEDETSFSPSERDVLDTYHSVIDDLIHLVGQVPRLLHLREVKVHFAQQPHFFSLGTAIRQDFRCNVMKRKTTQLIQEDFKAAYEQAKTYEAYRKWFIFVEDRWPLIEAQWTDPSFDADELTPEVFESYIHDPRKSASREHKEAIASKPAGKVVEAINDLEGLCNKDRGILTIDSSKLRQGLQGQLENIQRTIHKELTKVARQRRDELIHSIEKKKRDLLRRPNQLPEFATFVASLNQIKEEGGTIYAKCDEVARLYEICEHNGISGEKGGVGPGIEDLSKKDILLGGPNHPGQPMREQLREQIENAGEFRVTQLKGMSAQLEGHIDAANEELLATMAVLNHGDYVSAHTEPRDVLQQLMNVKDNIESIEAKVRMYTDYQRLFEATPAEWTNLTAVKETFHRRHDLWYTYDMFQERRHEWGSKELRELDENELKEEIEGFFKKSHRLNREIGDEVSELLLEHCVEERKNLPVMIDLCNKDMTSEHWEEIFRGIGKPFPQAHKEDSFTLSSLRHYKVFDPTSAPVVAEVSAKAKGQAQVRKVIGEIASAWEAIMFVTQPHRDSQDVFILGDIMDVLEKLEEDQMTVQSQLASRFATGDEISARQIRRFVEEWDSNLATVSAVLDEWVQLQRSWMYLEFIFSSDDIKKQLPEETKKFHQADKDFKELIGKARAGRTIVQVCTEKSEKSVLDTIKNDNAILDEVQKRLEEYLELKRSAFPRFYFLSNDELLEILSDVRNPRKVQPHLHKCFDNMKSLAFNNEDASEVGGMRSSEGEEVDFKDVVEARGNVEVWLGRIESMMKESLHAHMSKCVEGYRRSKRADWFFQFPAQCILCVDMIMWSSEVESAIRKAESGDDHALESYVDAYNKQILGTVDLVKLELTGLQRQVVNTIIVIDVHNWDMARTLVKASVNKLSDFTWSVQLRYYWVNGDVNIQHCAADFRYGYEYLGNQPRLVITPLTDRAYLTCTSALAMNLGAAPQGPAGTGKTESVKDLGKGLARQVVVFNCSDGINVSTMSQFFAGLAQAGAWACFDEFNRIELEVLSVIAMQMLTITTNLSAGHAECEFDGRKIKLSPDFGVFITMNPGYAGRTELPDNLKSLFRPICMMIPDYRLIAQIMFYSEGFSQAENLSQKMVQLYKLSSEQLSKQYHYDFGMRAVKSILVMAGRLKRGSPDEDEDMLLIRAMRDSNIPKFLRDDTVLFQALIRDLFPNVQITEVSFAMLEQFIEDQLTADGLQVVKSFVGKVVQVFDTMVVRHGMMTVGDTETGKTTILENLKKTLTKIKASGHDPEGKVVLYNTVKTHWCNPKSITSLELYGEVNPVTREWSDGVLSHMSKMVAREGADGDPTRNWLVFDGPVDAVWIENLNTVLDDNRMLCLNSGERIKIPHTVIFVFEVQDLAVASPATVSRCGMVYMEPFYLEGTGWPPICRTLNAQLQIKHGEERWLSERVQTLVDRLVPMALDFVRKHCKEYIASVNQQLVVSLLHLLEAFVYNHPIDDDEPKEVVVEKRAPVEDEEGGVEGGEAEAAAEDAPPEEEEESNPYAAKKVKPADINRDDPGYYAKMFDMYFITSLIWSIGGNILRESREKFANHMRDAFLEVCPALPYSADPYAVCPHKKSGSFVTWEYKTPRFVYRRGAPFFEMFVPTADTTCFRTLQRLLSSVNRHVLFNGVTGVGKSAITQDFIFDELHADRPESEWSFFAAVMSAQTSSKNLQERIETKLHKKRSNLIGAPPGKRMIFFLDDLNMPNLETYGASPPIELVRQMIGQGGFYDRKKVSLFRHVEDVVILASCGPPGGGRNQMTQRLTAKFNLLCTAELSTHTMKRIFYSMLHGFLGIFGADVRQMSGALVDATLECYSRIAAEMRPTPKKSHYTFNLRDLSKVVQGILMIDKGGLPNKEALIRLWCHEATRVFHDRLVDEKDKSWWWRLCEEIYGDIFGERWNVAHKEVLFGSYMHRDDKIYEEVPDIQKYHEKVVNDYEVDYGIQEGSEKQLVYFKDALHHLSRICRVTSQPRGNLLLVGVGGSGRQSLARMGVFMCNCRFASIVITKNYGMNEFHENLRKVLCDGGCDNKPIAFLLSDSQIFNEQMVEDINNVLNTGEVPNLLENEDYERILREVRVHAKKAGKAETRPVLLAHFTQLVRDNVHIIFTMSPIGEAFRTRLRMFPSLVNCCTIDWYTKWPEDALLSVAERAFRDADLGSDEVRQAICKMCVKIHRDVEIESEEYYDALRRRNYTTPTSYLSLIDTYKEMLATRTAQLAEARSRYEGGLNKLKNTTQEVDEMKELLRTQQPELVKKAKNTQTLMVTIDQEKKEADIVASACAKEELETQAKKNEVQAKQDECQGEVDKAMPAFEAALAALKTLQKDDITLLKTMGSPPDRVQLVLSAVLLLIGEKDLAWSNAKRKLGDLHFLDHLATLNAEAVPESSIRKMQKTYMNNPEFDPEKVKGASLAAMSLCMWARAVVNFNRVTKDMAPLKAKLEIANQDLQHAEQSLQAARDKQRASESKVARLEQDMQQAVDEQKRLEENIKVTEGRLVNADKLISGLGSESKRWEESVIRLSQEEFTVLGTMLLASGCVAYVGPFTALFRSNLIEGWTKSIQEDGIPVDEQFGFETIPDPVQVRNWGIKGLPMDKFSIENATIVSKSPRWTLCIDPQGQANRWIRAMHENLCILKLSDGKFMKQMEDCLRRGRPVLLENVGEELDAALDPILLNQTVKKPGGRIMMKLGEEEVDYDPEFRFYITTKMPNPHYMPELQIKVTIVNFTVTQKGLEDQLLAEVIRYEKAELEEQLDQVVVMIADGKAQLKDIEDKILQQLAAATGNVLDNQELIQSLGESKVLAEEITAGVEKGEKAKQEIGETRERYRIVATRGSLNYTVIAELGGLDHMYQYSLEFFKRLVQQTLRRTEKNDDIDKRTAALMEAVTAATYSTICRGLFERDKQIFAFLMVSHIFRAAGTITHGEWNFVLNGSAGVRPRTNIDTPEFLTDKAWAEIQVLAEQPGLEELLESFASDAYGWKQWVKSDEPHQQPLPGGLDERLTPFQRLLVLRSLREDKVQYGITQVNGAYLGKTFTESPQFDLDACFKDSSNTTPVIFVLTSGTDPTALFYEFAAQKGWGERLLVRSLGQDQGVIAEQYIKNGMRSGDWVYLQNCHVYTSWMRNLEQLCEELVVKGTRGEVHQDFRLFLTSKPDKHFPVSVLQTGIKVTKEPPMGLKANLRDSFNGAVTPELWMGSRNPNAWKRLLFALTFFHAIIQERRKYGALGWNIRYEWNQSDLAASVHTLKTYLEDCDDQTVPWDAIQYLCGVINYGGRVTDFLDTRCLRTILNGFFCPKVVQGEFLISPDGVYRIPQDVDKIESVREYLADLPPYEKPELFGLHDNANITSERNESKQMLQSLVEVQPRVAAGGGARSADDLVADMAVDFAQRLPQGIDRERAHEETYKTADSGEMVSLGTFVAQEIDVFNYILSTMQRTLKDLSAAIRGEVVMSAQLESMFNDFLVNRVPGVWGGMKLSYLSRKPLASWFVDTCDRLMFLREWNDNGPPTSFWLPGFYFPQGFLTAVFQTHSRRFKIPIDELKFKTHVTEWMDPELLTSEPAAGVYCHGFFMEGGRWDRPQGCVEEPHPGELYINFPIIWLEPVTRDEASSPHGGGEGDEDKIYEVPLYKTMARQGTLTTTGLSTNLVATFHINAGTHGAEHWIRRSVALLCMLDD
eukprot:Hpha_TRINITY_DN16720_c2_g4::TRINITY_DN16720_c2_g4_i3::g.79638::m.79638/K10408/DNAH; dynein heavy chain, axonemal